MGHDVESVFADGVTGSTELLDISGGNVANRLDLEGVAEKNGTSDIARAEPAHGVVKYHGTLGVSTQDDLSVGALRKDGCNKLGHNGATIGTQLSVALN